MKKLITLSAALAMAVSLCACGAESSSSESVKTETTTVAEKLSPADQLLEDVKGTYDELFTVICDQKYDQVWLDNCEKFVGKDMAESTAKMLKMLVYTASKSTFSEEFLRKCFLLAVISQKVFKNGKQAA